MEVAEDVVIVGAGIAGLATSLGLQRLGISSLVLEEADSLRTPGLAFEMWSNAWRAADALGIGDVLRSKHTNICSFVTTSINSGLQTSEYSFVNQVSPVYCEFRGMNIKVLLETLENELSKNTIRYSSKVIGIEIKGPLKYIHLADGRIIRTKVLVGSDGVNSRVAKFLGLNNPLLLSRFTARGLVHFEDGHNFEPKCMQYYGEGAGFGIIPCDDHSIFWIFTFPSSQVEKEMEQDPSKLKPFILSKLGNVTENVKQVFAKTDPKTISCVQQTLRSPWELFYGTICKDNICVVGDALHPMTPELGQGACSALEDGVVLARCLGEAMKQEQMDVDGGKDKRVEDGLKKFVKERRWRSFELVITSYLVGWIQQGQGVAMTFLRDKIIAKRLIKTMINKTMYDCGKLTGSGGL